MRVGAGATNASNQAMLVTSPSMAPKTEARSAPPETSAWVCPTSARPVGAAFINLLMRAIVVQLLIVDNPA